MDLGELAARLDGAADRVRPILEHTVHRQADELRDQVRANASGRPGPNVITGQYRSSWRVEPFPVADGGGAEVGTGAPQGRRLEFGFYDMTDSIGRHYFQPPFPHVEPAVTALSARYEQAFRIALNDIFGGGS